MPSSLSALSWSRVGWVSITWSPSVVVVGAADVVVSDHRPVRGLLGPLAIEARVEDGFDGLERARADDERPFTGCFQPLAVVAPSEVEDAAARSEALLGVRPLAQDTPDERRGMRSDCAGLVRDALERPVAIAPVA